MVGAGSDGGLLARARAVQASPTVREAQVADIPVLLVSAAIDLRWQAVRLEAAGSIAKPYDIDELIETVNQILATERTT